MATDKRWRHAGRRTGASFVQIPHFVLESQQWADLPPNAIKLLMELARQYKGKNNGDLSATMSTLKARGWSSEPTVWKHLRLLEERGWIVKTKQGSRYTGCNLYAVTWWKVDPCDGKHLHPVEHKASNAWKNQIATAKNEVRDPQKLKCEGVKLQKLKGEAVRMRPAA